MTPRASWLLASLALCCLAAPLRSQTTVLEEKTLTLINYHGITPDMTSSSSATTVAGPGVELPSFGVSVWVNGEPMPGFMSIDLSNTSIRITANANQPFGYFEVVQFLDTNEALPPITSVTVNPATNWNGFDASDIYVSPSGSYFQVNLTAQYALQGQQISLDLEVAGITCQTDLGHGGPGSAQLAVCGGDLSAGTTADLLLDGGPPLTQALLLVGLTEGNAPFKGGTLVPVPWLAAIPAATDANGRIVILGIMGGGGPLSAYVQVVLADAGQPLGVDLSNAVRLDVLP